MSPQNTQSPPESQHAQPQAISKAPILNAEREAVIATLARVDVRGDSIPDGETEKKMLEWTINEIRRTCGHLPVEKLKVLIQNITKVMRERSVQQQKIATELTIQREKLKQEIDAEASKSKYEATSKDRVLKYFQDHTSIRLFSKNKLDDIGDMKPLERAEFEKRLENDNGLLAKFIDGWQNDRRWRDKVEKENPKSYAILRTTFDNLVKKYDIQIEPGDLLSAIEKKVAESKVRFSEKQIEKMGLNTLSKKLSRIHLAPAMDKIQWLVQNADTYSPLIFGEITSGAAGVRQAVANIRASTEYRALQSIAATSKDPTVKERLRIFDYALQNLDHVAWKLTKADVVDLRSTERRKNYLTEVASKLSSAISIIERGEMLVETFREGEGNTAKSFEQFEAEIQAKVNWDGGAAKINAKGFSEYLTTAYIQGKLTHDYLRDKKFLSQVALHWKLQGRSGNQTESQKILSQTDSGKKVLAAFQQILAQDMEHSFNEENIRNGRAFSEVALYMEKQGVRTEEGKEIVALLQKARGNGTEEMLAISSRLNALRGSKDGTIRELAERVHGGLATVLKVAKVDANGHTRETVGQFLKHISSTTLRADLAADINKLSQDKKLNKSDFNANVRIEQLIQHPEIVVRITEALDRQMGKLENSKSADDQKDFSKLKKVTDYLKARRLERSVQTMAEDTDMQKAMTKAWTKASSPKSIQEAMQNVRKNGKEVSALSSKVDQVVSMRAKIAEETEKLEKQTDLVAMNKILRSLGFDDKVTVEMITKDSILGYETLQRMGIVSEKYLNGLTPHERAQFDLLRQIAARSTERKLGAMGTFGTANRFHEDSNAQLSQRHPELAIQKASNAAFEAADRRYLGSESGDRSVSAQNTSPRGEALEYSAKSLSNAPIGQPIRIDSDTVFVREADGSCSIKTPYSTETIPPEKANIAVGYIRVAKQFDGLDLVGSLHETLQSCASHPLLSKMKDGASKKEICGLIRHFADVLGVEGYNRNADSPRAMLTSVKNCLPLGKSFWELAEERGLMRANGTIDPIAISQTFQAEKPAKATDKHSNTETPKATVAA